MQLLGRGQQEIFPISVSKGRVCRLPGGGPRLLRFQGPGRAAHTPEGAEPEDRTNPSLDITSAVSRPLGLWQGRRQPRWLLCRCHLVHSRQHAKQLFLTECKSQYSAQARLDSSIDLHVCVHLCDLHLWQRTRHAVTAEGSIGLFPRHGTLPALTAF